MEHTEKTVLLIINNLSHSLPKPLSKIAYQTHNLILQKTGSQYSNCHIWKWYSNLITGFLFNHKEI